MRFFLLALLVAAPLAAQPGNVFDAPSLADEAALVVVEKKASEVGFYASDGTRLAGIPVGQTPHEMVLHPDGRYLYVSDNGVLWMDYQGPGGNTISVIDLEERRKIGVIPMGKYHRPHGMWFDPETHRMIVTSENPDSLVLVDPDSYSVVRAYDNGGKAPHMVAFGPEGQWAYASNSNSDTIGVVDISGKTPTTTIEGCGRPQGGALSEDGSRYYVTCSNSGTIQVIDTAERKAVGEIETGEGVNRVAVTPDGETLVYSIGGDGTQLGFADIATLEETGRVDLGGSPLSCSLSKDGKYAFAGVQDNDEIYVVSVEHREVVQVIETPEGHGPDPVMELGTYEPPE